MTDPLTDDASERYPYGVCSVEGCDRPRHHGPSSDDASHPLAGYSTREDPDFVMPDITQAADDASLPLHRTEAGWPNCSTCDGGGCPDCTDPA